ncbi:hypothetical protein PanWU01x14_364750, partial [Parasponia andersonii]
LKLEISKKMTTFNPSKMGLRYIYLDDPYDETNLTGPIGGRMDVGIFASDEKTEAAISPPLAMAGSFGALQLVGAGSWWPGGAPPVVCLAGRWLAAARRLPPVVCGREKQKERERSGGSERRERERRKRTGHVALSYRAVQFFKNCT